jgi:zinc transport system substrate-binding protein
VQVIEDALVAVDPEGTAIYEANAERYEAALDTLDRELVTGLADCERREIVTAHAAFGWLADRYDLEQHAIAGISPDDEPSASRLAELADLARDEGVTTVFTETLVSDRVARALAREAGGLRTAVLNPLEGLTREQREAGADYLSVMRENLAVLRDALGCS